MRRLHTLPSGRWLGFVSFLPMKLVIPIGLGHNYYDSKLGRIYVMNYPHSLITSEDDENFYFSEVHDNKIDEWDKVTVDYGYRWFAPGTDEDAILEKILNNAWESDVIYMSNEDMSANPKVDQWSNGTDPAVELNRMMKVCRVELDRFDERVIKHVRPMATTEEVLVPLYMRHRYQVAAAAAAPGWNALYLCCERRRAQPGYTSPSRKAKSCARYVVSNTGSCRAYYTCRGSEKLAATSILI